MKYSLSSLGIALLAVTAAALNSRADDWPQWLGPQRDGIWRETQIIERFPDGGPPIRWRVPIGGGYSSPSIADGRVFVTDRQLDPAAAKPASGFAQLKLPGLERVLCLNEADGSVLWSHKYDSPYDVQYPAGPRAAPLISGGKVFTLGAMGHLLCLDAEKGTVLWSRDFAKDFNVPVPVWGFAAHPLLDGNKLICLVGGNGSTVVAFDKDSGKELWRALSAKEPGYCPPMIFEAGGKRQLIVWHPEALSSLDPETGKVYWSEPQAIRSGLTVPTPRKLGDLLFLTSFYNGSLALRLAADKPAAAVIWASKKVSERDTDALHSIMSTPFLEGGHVYGVCSYGQFRCIRADNGERVWETLEPTTRKETRWGNAFIVKNGDRFFLANELGDLIIARLSPAGYEEISRAHLIEPTNTEPGRPVVWSHPAFANRRVYMRNDKELVCADLAKAN